MTEPLAPDTHAALAPAPSEGGEAFFRLPTPAPRLPQPRLALRRRAEVALPDRSRFREHLEQRLLHGAGTPLALLHVELEPQEGEGPEPALESLLALRLTRALRAGDVVGCMAAAQFVGLLAGVPNRCALERIAERVRGVLESPLDPGACSASVRAHVGIAVSPRDGVTSGVLLKHADEAAFRARAHRIGPVFFDPRLDP